MRNGRREDADMKHKEWTEAAASRHVRLRSRVDAELLGGDPSGEWRRIAERLDHADHARELADEWLEFGLALLEAARQ